ncbi:MAG: ATP-binding cassette domain-containing protein [Desulfomonilaceae bacterium]|nr:ATP-binding cassette domain-containing protein [Desulfomonilaceae bacterium]
MSEDLQSNHTASPPIISVRNLTVGYGDEIVLRDVSFDVLQGEVLAILGRSGCGKSTLFKAMVGLIEPIQGEVYIDGEKVLPVLEGASEKILRKVGVLFQSGALFSSMTLAENVAFPIRLFTKLAERIVERLVMLKLAEVGLTGKERLLPSELSGGMQKRAALARAMALDPKILFFDEPSAGLDPVTSAEIDQTILRINATLGTTVVIVTHELHSILTVADRVIMLDKDEKNIIAAGSPWELKENARDQRVVDFFNRSPADDRGPVR